MPTRGYSSYHGRRSIWKVLLAVLLILLLLAAGAFLLLQDYIVYESDGSIRLELPIGDRGLGGSVGNAGAPSGTGGGPGGMGNAPADLPPVEILPSDAPEEPDPLQAVVLTAAALCDADASYLADARAAGRTGFVVELKGDNGAFYYTSPRALKDAAVPAAVTESQLHTALDRREDLTAVAQLSCFHDSAYAFSDMAGAGVCQKNGYIWYDYQNSHWLDPAKAGTKDYLFAVAEECRDMGFDEILLTQFHYPVRGKLYKIDYSKMTVTREDALCTFLTELREVLGEDTALSIEMDADILLAGTSADGGIDLQRLLPLVDHICVSAGERETEVLEALRAAGAEEPEDLALFRRGDEIVSAAAETAP